MTKKQIPDPIAIGLFICDSVIVDKSTGKKSLIGLFNNINVTKLPAVVQSLNIFIALTGLHGENKCKLNCIKQDTNKIIIETEGTIECKDPLAIVEVNFIFKKVVFLETGQYRFELSSNAIPLISRKFRVSIIERNII